MKLNQMTNPPEGVPADDAYEVTDLRTGKTVNSGFVRSQMNAVLFPGRPLRICMEFEASPVPDSLLGALFSRAQLIAFQNRCRARIYTHCVPGDDAFLQSLQAIGLKADDALVRLRSELPLCVYAQVPAGLTLIHDVMFEDIERRYFLERYNRLYGTDHDEEWMNDYVNRDDFTRIILIGPKGLAGEILCWREENTGVIGFVHVAQQMRRLGIGSALVSSAAQYFMSLNLRAAEINLRTKTPHIKALLKKLGFQENACLVLYPGMDIDPE